MAKVTPSGSDMLAQRDEAAQSIASLSYSGMLAYKVMQIQIATRLGSIALAIKAALRNDKVQEAGKLAALHLVFHSAGSKAFGNKSGHKRDEAFSDALAEHVSEAVRNALGGLFENIELATSAYVKPDRIEGLAKQMRALGMSEADVAEMVAKAKAAAENEKAETVEESDDEVVG